MLLQCSRLVIVALGFLAEIHALPTNKSTNTLRRWGPERVGEYTLSGFYDPDPAVRDPKIDMHSFLESFVNVALRPRGVSLVTQSEVETFSAGDFGQNRININWLTSGPSFTYAKCVTEIEIIRSYLQTAKGARVNTNPGSILLQRELQPQFSIKLSTESGGRDISIGMAKETEFQGQFWPRRFLPLLGIKKAIATAFEKLSHSAPEALVQDKFVLRQTHKSVLITIGIYDSPPTGLIIADILTYLDEMENFYGSRKGAELHGILKNPAAGDNVFGYLRVEKNFLKPEDSPDETVTS